MTRLRISPDIRILALVKKNGVHPAFSFTPGGHRPSSKDIDFSVCPIVQSGLELTPLIVVDTIVAHPIQIVARTS
jgi:hypothetical protein